MAGALLLALYTRGPDAHPLPGASWMRWAALPVLLLGVFRFFAWLRQTLWESRESRIRRRHKVVLALSLASLVASFTTYTQVDGLLQGLHQTGQGLHGISSIDSKEGVRAAVLAWDSYLQDSLQGPPGNRAISDRNAPMTIVAWAFAIDTGILIPAYAALFSIMLLWALRLSRRRSAASSPSAEQSLSMTADQLRVSAFRRVVKVATGALGALVLADAVENWLAVSIARDAWFSGTRSTSPHVGGIWPVALRYATLTKITVLIALLLLLGWFGLFLARHRSARDEKWTGAKNVWRTLLAVRVQLIGVALLLPLIVHEQVPDAIRRWMDSPQLYAWGLVLILLLGVGLWHSARWMLAYAQPGDATGSWWPVWVLAGVGSVAILGFGALENGWRPERPAVALVVIVVVVLWGAYARRNRTHPAPPVSTWGHRGLPPALAAAAIAIVGLAVFRVAPGDLVYESLRGEGQRGSVVLLLAGVLMLVFAAAAVPTLLWLGDHHPPSPAILSLRWVPAAGAVGCLLAWVLIVAWISDHIIGIASSLGAVGVLASFALLVTYSLSFLIASANRLVGHSLPVLREMGFGRVPVLSLLLVWFVAVSAFMTDGRMHDAIPAGTTHQAKTGMTLRQEFLRWQHLNCLDLAADAGGAPGGTQTRDAVPLIFVSSAGGGIRAAVWTARILSDSIGFDRGSCESQADLPGTTRSNWVFAMSGVSGASLGMATYSAQLATGQTPSDTAGWLGDRLGGDFLSPALGWMLYVELPWSLLHFDANRDRAAILEQSWEEAWPSGEQGTGMDLFSLQGPGTRPFWTPLLVFNGTAVESGCRFNASVLASSGRDPGLPASRCLSNDDVRLNRAVLPATEDLVNYVCRGQYLSLAKAVLLSARFPVISPAGHLTGCESEPPPETLLVDGGYLENSGAGTTVDLWRALLPMVRAYNANPASPACIVPYAIQIDNGWDEPAGPGSAPNPAQLGAPISALNATRGGRTAEAEQSAQLEFNGSAELRAIGITGLSGPNLVPADRYARFAPIAHPGPKAPLGWTLSSASVRDLLTQYTKNGTARREVASWFSGHRCTVAKGSGA